MLSLIARWYIKPGCEESVWEALQALPAEVLKEPGTLMYLIHRPDSDPARASMPPLAGTEIIFVEGYADQAAFEAHLGGKAFTDFVAAWGDSFIRPFPSDGCATPGNYIAVENLVRLGGFVRPAAAGPQR